MHRPAAIHSREKLLAFASRFLRKSFGENTRIFIISGRYEFHNKGIDIFLQALGRIDKEMVEGQDVIAFICVMGEHMAINPAALSRRVRPGRLIPDHDPQAAERGGRSHFCDLPQPQPKEPSRKQGQYYLCSGIPERPRRAHKHGLL